MTTTTDATARLAAIYVRISQDRGGAGLGVERQETECRALAGRLGWTVADVYSDNDISAFNGKRRPDYERMLADIGAGRINAVIAWHPDRLHRRSLELERYISVCDKHGVANQTVTAGIWDLSTATGKMIARNIGTAATFESEHKSERLRSARIQQAAQGKHHGGIRCYGYEKDGMTVVPDEAAEIVAACTAVAQGASLRGIVRGMNERKVPTATGHIAGQPVLDKKTGQPLADSRGRQRLHLGWTSQQLRQTLMSPRIAGYSTHKGVIVGTAAWPAIVADVALWRNVEKILDNDARCTNKRRAGGVKWLGSGLYVCTCGQRSLRASVTGGSKRYTYRCAHSRDKSVTHVTRDAVALDAYVERIVVERLARPGTVEQLARRDDTVDVAGLRAELADIGAAKDEAARLFADSAIDAAQLAAITKRHNQRAEKINEALAGAGWRSPLAPLTSGDIAAAWATLPLAQRRAILDVVCDVRVLPATPTTRGFNPDGVRIEWKVSA
jgi:DNA invertase Pin-like site-specific DNA recombinase